MKDKTNRVEYLDGLRGIAVLFVVAHHYWATCNYPGVGYNTIWGQNRVDWLEYGRLGVQLFFMISGYVILMTLNKCQSIGEFFYRRWVRLFPAMLVASIIILVASRVISEYPFHARLVDTLPGLSFLAPTFWEKLLQVKVYSLDDVFWTLYLEAQFYFLVAFLHKQFPKGVVGLIWGIALAYYAVWAWASLYSLALAEKMFAFRLVFVGEHLPWFALGMSVYEWKTKRTPLGLAGCVFGGVFVVIWGGVISEIWLRLLLVGLFVCPVFIKEISVILSNRVFSYLGFISYPLYLLHRSLGLSIMYAFRDIPLSGWVMFLPIVLLLLMVKLSEWVVVYAEKPIQSLFKRRTQ